ncbi:MAG: PepSY domain-containing protein [Chitinophagaceae bacterium]|nr:PepSY domain-containing protein [Chitinophagaceae bacterium]
MFIALRSIIVRNAEENLFDSESGVSHRWYAIHHLRYNNISFTQNYGSDKNPKETIEVNYNGLDYILISENRDSNVSILSKNPAKTASIQKKAKKHFCEVLSKMNYDIKVSSSQAVDSAIKDTGGFLGSWVDAELNNHYWHISASSKSAKPPMYYIIDANTGAIVLKLDNSDDPKQKLLLENFIKKSKNNN